MELKEEYAVYVHVYDGSPFYVGSGVIFKTITGLLRGRPYFFYDKSNKWFEFCKYETDRVEVKILFITNDRQIAFDIEEQITKMYMEVGFPLVNIDIGTRHSEERKKQYSIALSGENNPMYGKRGKDSHMYGKTAANAKKVLVINNESGKSKTFDSIARVYEFISQHGFDKTKRTLQDNLKKGKFSFKNYTLELIA